MLFLDSKILHHRVASADRNTLLGGLQERGFNPLIRSLRVQCFNDLLAGADRFAEMDTAMASWAESTLDEPFVPGDVFAFSDYLLYLIFDNDEPDGPTTSAGIVYSLKTSEPFRRLDSFCVQIRDLLMSSADVPFSDFPNWLSGNRPMPQGFRAFVERQDTDSLYTALRKDTMSKRILAASHLEDENARLFLRTARNAHQEGYAVKLLSGETRPETIPLAGLEDVGLVEREVQVSCRKTGHALFRLPNADALAVVTVSDATCSECGSAVADENVEEVIAPTLLATSLLEDGSWLVSRMHHVLRQLGVPESEIAIGPSEGSGSGQMMANICGESFLIATRDGDLTPTFARAVVDMEIETEASHLMIVATGRIHKEAGLLLRNHARRRVSGGQDFEMIIADDVASAGRELERALERVSQRIIAEQLCVLDNSVGVSVSRLVLTKFQLINSQASEEPRMPAPQSEPEWSSNRVPLTLAAAASMNDGQVVDVEIEHTMLTPEQAVVEQRNGEANFRSWD